MVASPMTLDLRSKKEMATPATTVGEMVVLIGEETPNHADSDAAACPTATNSLTLTNPAINTG
jgi:hypothetical protein